MTLAKQYHASEIESKLLRFWQESGIYQYSLDSSEPVYSIDTPPPTVSGHLHLGHIYSYSHADMMARYYRMNGYNVFYPMGYDDNGLPTERLVEKRLGISAQDVSRPVFIEKCLEVSKAAEADYRNLWERVGLSVDWRYTYRTIDAFSRRTSQASFLELYRQGLAYRQEAPAIWCPECKTSIAQAELNDMPRESAFVNLVFSLSSGENLVIATTRPELLPACVAIFVHPSDERYRHMVGKTACIPHFGQVVPILADAAADPTKGTGAVMCCTFGDTMDVSWWRNYHLPLIRAIDRDGRMTDVAGNLAGVTTHEARKAIVALLEDKGLITGHQPTMQSVRVHERCDTPVEYLMTPQWFIRVLEFKQRFLEAGEQVHWVPDYMAARYRAWVENLNWDWCISRQRYFGIPFPVWYCQSCKGVVLASEEQLPVDPLTDHPNQPCAECGGEKFQPETDILDTWATSSMSPQIVGRWLDDSHPGLYANVFPYSLRPQAHEIIRTWAFYTIVKSSFHYDCPPWNNVLISGWGLAGEGMGKISKSRGGGPMSPGEMIEKYSADAVRYWAASTGPGRDAIISEEKIQTGARLVTKLWNVARFCERFFEGYQYEWNPSELSPADQWIRSRLWGVLDKVAENFQAYDYTSAKSEAEAFFWNDLADNYLEMCKQRLYAQPGPANEAAKSTLYCVFLSLIKVFAPFLPYVTDEIYHNLFAVSDGYVSVHVSRWPQAESGWYNPYAEEVGAILVETATAIRRYKSERNLSLGTELSAVKLALRVGEVDPVQADRMKNSLTQASMDLISITRARQIEVDDQIPAGAVDINVDGRLCICVED